jgi:predicted amidophosphoribosyltransferase
VLGSWYAQDLKDITILKTVDIIIPVPLHNRKFRKGYNQVTTFGEALSAELNISYDSSILKRKSIQNTIKKVFWRD